MKLVRLPDGADARETLARRLRLESVRSPRVTLSLGVDAEHATGDDYRDVLEVLEVKHAPEVTIVSLRMKGTEPLRDVLDGADPAEARLLPFGAWIGKAPAYVFWGSAGVLGWTAYFERGETRVVLGFSASVMGGRYVSDGSKNGAAK